MSNVVILSLERELLGSLIYRPDLLDSSDLSIHDFSESKGKQVFEAISGLWETERPSEIDPSILLARLPGDGMGTYLGSLYDGHLRLDPSGFNLKLSQVRKLQLEKKILQAGKDGDVSTLINLVGRYEELTKKKDADLSSALHTGAQLLESDFSVDWVLGRLIPEQAITVLYAPGGMGKTTLSLQIAAALSAGESLWGISTKKKTCVYLDYENPTGILVEKVRNLNAGQVVFWTLASDPKPPLLDSDDFSLLFNLPPGSVLFFDSLRSAYSGDENDSGDVASIFGRLKQLREKDFTVILLHHSPKADDRIFKGSTAISDLSDHTLALYQVNREFKEISSTEPFPDALYCLGSGQKTRYERSCIYLRFTGTHFELAPSPDAETLLAIQEFLLSSGPKNQSELRNWMKLNLDIGKVRNAVDLLNKGEGRFWHSKRDAANKPRVYFPIRGKDEGKTE